LGAAALPKAIWWDLRLASLLTHLLCLFISLYLCTPFLFWRTANAIFGKIGRIAPEEATLELISSKCIPVLIYGLEACPLLKSDFSSLDFVVNRFFMKLFRTNSIDIVKQCQYHFGFPLPSDLWAKRVQKFDTKFYACSNLLCKINVR